MKAGQEFEDDDDFFAWTPASVTSSHHGDSAFDVPWQTSSDGDSNNSASDLSDYFWHFQALGEASGSSGSLPSDQIAGQSGSSGDLGTGQTSSLSNATGAGARPISQALACMSRGAASGPGTSTAELVARGCKTNLVEWSEFEQLLLDDEYPFKERPVALTSSFGIFRESPRSSRRAMPGPKDKWQNSGGERGAVYWPPAAEGAPARVRTQYGKVILVSGAELRYVDYTLVADTHPGLKKHQLNRHVFQVRPTNSRRGRWQPTTSSTGGEAANAGTAGHKKHTTLGRVARNQSHSPKSPAPSRLDTILPKEPLPGKANTGRKPIDGPMRIRDSARGNNSLGSRLLDLGFTSKAVDHAGEFEMQELKYMSFVSGRDEVGSLSSSAEGLKLTTAAGDFAEWHELADQAETFEEGDVVGICHGKVSRRTARAAMVGVVTEKAAVVGSLSLWTGFRKRIGAEIAYCGRVPVRVRGRVTEGDVLVSSGREDGLAIVVSNSAASNHDCQDCNLNIGCATEYQAPQRALQVGVAMQACEQHQDDVSLVEVAVTGPAMSSSTVQRRRMNGATMSMIRAVVFATLLVALLSTAAVWFAINNIQASEPAKPHPTRTTLEHGYGGDNVDMDNELFPQMALDPFVSCYADVARRAESLRHVPCYLYLPRRGVPGTVGVFQPVKASNCDHMLRQLSNDSQLLVADACWELQYGDAKAALSDDPFFEQLQLARVSLVSTSMDFTPVLVRDRKFRCKDNSPDTWAACPDSDTVFCDDIIPLDFAEAATTCASGQLQDLMFMPKEEGGAAQLYEYESTVPLDRSVYIRTLCPATCANRAASGVYRNTGRRLYEIKDSIGNSIDDKLGRKSPPPHDASGNVMATSRPSTKASIFSTWWLGGVPKKEPAHRSGSQNPPGGDLPPAEFRSGKPWLCLEDVLTNTSRFGLRSTFELGVRSFESDACASRSVICDPNADKSLTATCARLRDDTSSDFAMIAAICPPDQLINRTTGYCQINVGLPDWDAQEEGDALQAIGMLRPSGVQVPGSTSAVNNQSTVQLELVG